MQISLNDELFTRFEIDALVISSQKYTLALAVGCRLHNESFGFLFSELTLEITRLKGQNPRPWKEFELIREELLHPL